MRSPTRKQAAFEQAVEVLHFYPQALAARLFTESRCGQAERWLPILVRKGRLMRFKRREVPNQYIYSTPDRFYKWLGDPTPMNLQHGLDCSRIIVGLVAADRSVQTLSEKWLYRLRLGVKPDWGLAYANGVLLGEYSTAKNCQAGEVKRKLERYTRNWPAIAAAFAFEPIVLFVLDLPRPQVVELVSRYQPGDQFLFTDYQTFKGAANVLTDCIYLWKDGRAYPLRSHDLETE